MFESMAGESFAADVRRIKENDRAAMREEVDLSVRYFHRQQIADVEAELLLRFPSTQDGGSGQDISPCVIPLTERFVAEQSTLYNRPVRHTLTLPDGGESDATHEMTELLNDAYESIGFDELMHTWEQMVVLLGVSALWVQIHKDKVRPVIVLPHHIFPVPPATEFAMQMDVADPDDYAGMVVETLFDRETIGSAQGAIYTYLDDKEVTTYSGSGPDKPNKQLGSMPQSLGMMPLVFWHRSLAVDELLSVNDAVIARANRELNVAWSVLMDTLRMQGFATPVKKLANKNEPGARQLHGVRFPVVLDITEDFHYESAPAPFTETVTTLRELVQLIALCERENPEDFATNGAQAVSGFSKAVSSLPKLEARNERRMRAKAVAEGPLWLRMREALIKTGALPESVRGFKYHVEYADIEFPQTPDEESATLEMKFKWGLSTPAKELAHRKGMTVEQAQEEIDANKAAMGPQKQEGAPGVGLPPAKDAGGMLSRLIGGGRKAKMPIGEGVDDGAA